MNFRSINDMNHTILRELKQLPTDIDLVVGIPRSGMLAANMIALYLNKPLTDLAGLKENRLMAKGKRVVNNFGPDVVRSAKRVLIVDDCISQGTEFRKAREVVEDAGFTDRAVFCAVYSFPENPDKVDVVMEIVPRPMCFQWSCMHTKELIDWCVDIDGILCLDVEKHNDDDGPRYLEFLDTARPLFVPTAEVGWLVTCRLEKYRPQTEAWMARHGVKYRKLIMMDMPSREAREASGSHASYKAKVYRETGASLFIESSPGLAARVAAESGLPVLCPEICKMFSQADNEWMQVMRQRYGIGRWMRRLRRAPAKLMRPFLNGGRVAG